MKLISFESWPIWAVVATLLMAAAIIGFAGARMTRVADRLADATQLGEALFGAVLLGGSTSLPGIITSIWTAYGGYPQLSVSNAIGGIAAQTVFLVVADITYRHVNLEHAAASFANLMQATMLMILLAIPLLAMAGPDLTVLRIHPASILLLAAYGFGLRLVSQAKAEPLWKPQMTRETIEDEASDETISRREGVKLWLAFAVLAAIVGAAGFVVAQTGIAIAQRTVLSETIVGMLLTSIATSLPELVTSIAAVRQGALTLAVGGIVGGNSFDVLFIAFADMFYRDGSIYHAIVNQQIFIIALTILLTGILLLGLLRRERTGIANIGFESFLVLVLYIGAVALLFYA